MRVLVLHDDHERPRPNGENTVVDWEVKTLRDHGVAVRLIESAQSLLKQRRMIKGIQTLGGAWSPYWLKRIAAEIANFSPDIVHIHNIWPHMTPSVYFACRNAGVPIVQTLHNYRIACNGELLTRNGSPCHLCLGKPFGWPGIWHRCSTNSYSISLVKATTTSIHTRLNTWNRSVSMFLAVSQSMRSIMIEAGIEAQRIRIKSSFAPDPGYRESQRSYFCFAGRLSHEKGIRQMIDAWRALPDVALKIAGAGPLEKEVLAFAASHPNVEYLGTLPAAEVPELMRGAIATVLPSTWDEPSPVVLIQSFSVGTPMIASDFGSRHQSVTHGETGLVFPGTEIEIFASLVRWANEHPEECRRMGAAARKKYEKSFSIAANHARLMACYEEALSNSRLKSSKTDDEERTGF